MPRENSQKRHRRQRLRAEAHKRAEAEARAAARAAVVAREVAIAKAFRGGRPILPTYPDTVTDTVRYLLEMAQVDPAVRGRVLELYARVHDAVPSLHGVGSLPLMVLLAREPWLRPLSTWTPWGHTTRARRDELVDHLLVRYPVPPVLYGALNLPSVHVARVPEEDAWGVALLAALGRGESPFDAIRSGRFPVPLTRRMVARFLSARPGTGVVRAIRAAQVAEGGGRRRLVDALLRTRLAGLRGVDPEVGEPFWAGVIGWFARQRDLPLGRLPAFVDYIEAQQRAAITSGTRFSLAGRTGTSLGRLVAAWKTDEVERTIRFPTSGYLPLVTGEWAVREVGSPVALRAHGREMNHCVGEYGPLIRQRKVAIFVVDRAGAPTVTVEVAIAAGRVVQAKAAGNAACPSEARRVVDTWAAQNRLEVAARL